MDTSEQQQPPYWTGNPEPVFAAAAPSVEPVPEAVVLQQADRPRLGRIFTAGVVAGGLLFGAIGLLVGNGLASDGESNPSAAADIVGNCQAAAEGKQADANATIDEDLAKAKADVNAALENGGAVEAAAAYEKEKKAAAKERETLQAQVAADTATCVTTDFNNLIKSQGGTYTITIKPADK